MSLNCSTLCFLVLVFVADSCTTAVIYLQVSDPTTRGRALPTDSPQQKEAPFPAVLKVLDSDFHPVSQTYNSFMGVLIICKVLKLRLIATYLF